MFSAIISNPDSQKMRAKRNCSHVTSDRKVNAQGGSSNLELYAKQKCVKLPEVNLLLQCACTQDKNFV